MLNSLRDQDLFIRDPVLEQELVRMEEGKVELQALLFFGLDFFSEIFLPELLFGRDSVVGTDEDFNQDTIPVTASLASYEESPDRGSC